LFRVRYALGSQLDHLEDIPPEVFSVNQKLMQVDTIAVPEKGIRTVFFQVPSLPAITKQPTILSFLTHAVLRRTLNNPQIIKV
jgi:hypothetical protein